MGCLIVGSGYDDDHQTPAEELDIFRVKAFFKSQDLIPCCLTSLEISLEVIVVMT